jgi:hypothetical protein
MWPAPWSFPRSRQGSSSSTSAVPTGSAPGGGAGLGAGAGAGASTGTGTRVTRRRPRSAHELSAAPERFASLTARRSLSLPISPCTGEPVIAHDTLVIDGVRDALRASRSLPFFFLSPYAPRGTALARSRVDPSLLRMLRIAACQTDLARPRRC